jgi:lysophospholipase L1-like esterase
VYADHVAGPLRPAGSRGLPARLAQAGVAAIDLLPAMTTSIRSVPDLYMPNDTHLSAAGFRLLGEQVSAWLQAERFARP